MSRDDYCPSLLEITDCGDTDLTPEPLPSGTTRRVIEPSSYDPLGVFGTDDLQGRREGNGGPSYRGVGELYELYLLPTPPTPPPPLFTIGEILDVFSFRILD